MSIYRVVVTDQVFPSVDLERELLANIDAELVVAEGTREQVLTVAESADALLNTFLPIDADFIRRLGDRCQIVARYGIGVDNIDLDAAHEAGIAVTNVPDYCIEEVASHALTLLLMLLRRVSDGLATVYDSSWGIAGVRPIRRLSTITVGLIGYGRIARHLAALLRPLDVDLVVYDPYVSADVRAKDPARFVESLDDLLTDVDAVSIHCPLTLETHGLLGAEQFEKLPDSAVVVNTSRGPLVDTRALVTALREGTIRAAGLDVVDPEPPEDPAALAATPGLLLTPHVGFYSEEALQESQRKASTQVIKALIGDELDYRVDC